MAWLSGWHKRKGLTITNTVEDWIYDYWFEYVASERVYATSVRTNFEQTLAVKSKVALGTFEESGPVFAKIFHEAFIELRKASCDLFKKFSESMPIVGSFVKKFEESHPVASDLIKRFSQKAYISVKAKTIDREEQELEKLEWD